MTALRESRRCSRGHRRRRGRRQPCRTRRRSTGILDRPRSATSSCTVAPCARHGGGRRRKPVVVTTAHRQHERLAGEFLPPVPSRSPTTCRSRAPEFPCSQSPWGVTHVPTTGPSRRTLGFPAPHDGLHPGGRMPLEGRQLAAPVDLRALLRVGLDAEPDVVATSSATDRITWRELELATHRLAGKDVALGLAAGATVSCRSCRTASCSRCTTSCASGWGLVITSMHGRPLRWAREIDHALAFSPCGRIVAHAERG